ncbi:MAG: N-acetylmuramic acid 6-phosphate etherase [Bacteroidaceae bacterium]|nr:N-acetylmuramic acid 6-phosphate etherase [Bacteroidaceae bacterium]
MAITEQPSHYDNLETMSVGELVRAINCEDQTVAKAVERVLPQIEKLATLVIERMEKGGRIFYIGAGTSGRLGVLDASELPPTYGVSPELVVGIIAGGDKALRRAVENAEDNEQQGWKDIEFHKPTTLDTVIGIAASGTTPYVVGALRTARKKRLLTGCITSNPDTPLAAEADVAIETIVGPEFVTGSSRMKSGTAQKMVLNTLSTTIMIKLGRVKGNKMVGMQLTNAKLNRRARRMLSEMLGVTIDRATELLKKYGSVEQALNKLLRRR